MASEDQDGSIGGFGDGYFDVESGDAAREDGEFEIHPANDKAYGRSVGL
jgi:hypothetical protein